MNKEELVKEISKKTSYSQKQVSEVLNTSIESIMTAISSGDKVTLVNFGVFEQKTRAARKTRNPMTGDTIQVPEKIVPCFSAGKKFKEMVNK